MCKVRFWTLANKRRRKKKHNKIKPTTAKCHGTEEQLWTIHVQIIGVIIFTVGITLIVVCISIHDANSSSMPDFQCERMCFCDCERASENECPKSHMKSQCVLLLLLSSRNFGIDDINRCAVARFWPFAFSIPTIRWNYTTFIQCWRSFFPVFFFARRSGSLAWKISHSRRLPVFFFFWITHSTQLRVVHIKKKCYRYC